MKTYPFVSIIMPVYNAGDFLVEAVESILKQTYPNFELICVDDGSTDRSWKILSSLAKKYPKRMRIYRFTQNRGESAAANYAFSKARGAYIARMDADDVATNDRIRKQVAFMEANPYTIVLGSQATVIDKHGKMTGHKHTPLTHDAIYRAFAFVNAMIHPSIMYRRSLLPKRNKLYKNTYESTDDYHAYFELLHHGKFANLPEELICYRVHGTNKSLTNIKEKFWTDTKVRITAATKLGYKAPWTMIPTIVMQATIVTLLPESWLKEVFFYLRGIKKVSIAVPVFSFRFPLGTIRIKHYALSLTKA